MGKHSEPSAHRFKKSEKRICCAVTANTSPDISSHPQSPSLSYTFHRSVGCLSRKMPIKCQLIVKDRNTFLLLRSSINCWCYIALWHVLKSQEAQQQPGRNHSQVHTYSRKAKNVCNSYLDYIHIPRYIVTSPVPIIFWHLSKICTFKFIFELCEESP